MNDRAVIDAIWSEFKSSCSALTDAKNQTEWNKVVERVESFLSDDLRRLYVHKWRVWGLLLANLLHVISTDAEGSIVGLPTTTTTKRKAKSKKSKINLRHWVCLRHQFAAANKLDGPKLHLDANGRSCLKQIFAFELLVAEHEPAPGMEDLQSHARLNKEAWQMIEGIVAYRVYCAVLDQKQLQDVLELALAILDDHQTAAHMDPTELYRIASVVQHILRHSPFDLHGWLPKLVPIFASWLDAIGLTTPARYCHLLQCCHALCSCVLMFP